MKDVLMVNSYGGSILSAVMDMRLPIRGSYETSGYGEEIQRFNAPKLNFIANTKDWPSQDLSKSLVIGHPPCSAFSRTAGRNVTLIFQPPVRKIECRRSLPTRAV